MKILSIMRHFDNLKKCLKKYLKKCLALSVAFTSAGLLSLESEAAQRWKLHSAYNQNVPVIGHVAHDIADKVTALSHREIRVKAFEPGALVSGASYYDAVSKGAITAAYGNAGYNVGKNSAYAFFAAVPFGPDSVEFLAWMHHGGGQALADSLYQKDNIKFLACGIAPPETSGWFTKEIKSVKDLKGLKMRFLGLGARVMEKLGVSTQLMAGGDIYPAMEIGTLDATEFSLPAVDRALGFYQIAKHNYFPGWHQQSTVQELLINLKTWNSLTAEQQQLIETICLAQTTAMIAEGEATQFLAMQENEKNGVVNHRWPDEILQSFRSAWDEVIAEEIKANSDSKRIWQSYSEFRSQYKMWREFGYL